MFSSPSLTIEHALLAEPAQRGWQRFGLRYHLAKRIVAVGIENVACGAGQVHHSPCRIESVEAVRAGGRDSAGNAKTAGVVGQQPPGAIVFGEQKLPDRIVNEFCSRPVMHDRALKPK